MIIYPLIVAMISLIFALMVYRQYIVRRRPYQLLWTVALLQSAIASLAYILSITQGGHVLFFKVYYIFGALLVAAYLGLGSVYLAGPAGLARACAWGVGLLSVAGAWLILGAPVDPVALWVLAESGGSGQGVLQGKSWLPPLILMNTFGTVGVVASALISAWHLRRHQAAAGYVLGNVLIAGGVIILAYAGSATKFGASGFWLTMALGWMVIFSGFAIITGQGRYGTKS